MGYEENYGKKGSFTCKGALYSARPRSILKCEGLFHNVRALSMSTFPGSSGHDPHLSNACLE